MFINRGRLENLVNQKTTKINLNELKSEINFFDNLIVYKKNDKVRVYDRKCDHTGGKLISKGSDTFCPMHMWKFNPLSGQYDNGIKKKELEYSIKENHLEIKDSFYEPKILSTSKKLKTEIRFFNHAFLKISGEDFSFCTDPWAIGPAFNTGWWLKKLTKIDWLENLNNSDFIYISHNHPDHLHPLTLSKVDNKIPIIVPNFISNSTGKYIEELGFKNIIKLDFNIQYNLKETNLFISLLKSGDFREDSGMYFSNGEFTGLLNVDANMLNFDRLPSVDFYASSFAGGASGYPLMFENYQNNEKNKITIKNKNFLKRKNFDNILKTSPKYFMPYAGFFEEKLSRDRNINKSNKKNTIEDYSNFCEKNKIKLINVLKKDHVEFFGNKLIFEKTVIKNEVIDLQPEKYLEYYKREFSKIDENYIKKYFENCGFKDNLQLYILLTDDNFKLLNKNYFIDFTKNKICFDTLSKFDDSILKNKSNIKKLVLKIRKESFLNTIYNKLPWEDLSIGFQCKILRNPNLYNKDFWHHFTNIYITSKNVRQITNCGSCQELNQFLDSQLNQRI